MRFTIDEAKRKYDYYNKLYFNNELPESNLISFSITKAKSYIAQVVFPKMFSIDEYPSMNLSNKYEFENEHSLDHTIIHEMIHIYQWLKDTECGHGRAFKQFSRMIFIKSKGLFDIKRCHYGAVEKIQDDTTKKNIDEDCIVVINKENGQYRVYKNTNKATVLAQLLHFSFPREIYHYRGNLFNDIKSAKTKKIVRTISFHPADTQRIQKMKETATLISKYYQY
jgi:hypothetical protein